MEKNTKKARHEKCLNLETKKKKKFLFPKMSELTRQRNGYSQKIKTQVRVKWKAKKSHLYLMKSKEEQKQKKTLEKIKRKDVSIIYSTSKVKTI